MQLAISLAASSTELLLCAVDLDTSVSAPLMIAASTSLAAPR
jgi:hypothetical protein